MRLCAHNSDVPLSAQRASSRPRLQMCLHRVCPLAQRRYKCRRQVQLQAQAHHRNIVIRHSEAHRQDYRSARKRLHGDDNRRFRPRIRFGRKHFNGTAQDTAARLPRSYCVRIARTSRIGINRKRSVGTAPDRVRYCLCSIIKREKNEIH